jgi:hypothetical protein
MIARHTQADAIYQAAQDIGVRAEVASRGSAYQFTLKLGPEKLYQRTSPTQTNKDGEPRKVNGVCWHGHAAFFRRLFELAPQATVSSARIGAVRYTAANFEDTYPATGKWNIGSMYNPCYFQDACDYDTHPINRGSHV